MTEKTFNIKIDLLPLLDTPELAHLSDEEKLTRASEYLATTITDFIFNKKE